MRILFDNNVPDPLRRFLPGHTVRTAEQLKWQRLENGDLLQAAEAAGFDVMVTADQNIKYQQNLSGRVIALVVLGSNRWPFVKPQVAAIAEAVDRAQAGSYCFLEIPAR